MKCLPQTITNTRTHHLHSNGFRWRIKLTSRPATEQPTKIHSNTETALNVQSSIGSFVWLRPDVQFKHAILSEGDELACSLKLLGLQRGVSFIEAVPEECASASGSGIETSSGMFFSGAMPFAFSI
ncbi:hypothetical protein SLA2020_411720 [Shorea laevis]